MVAFACTRDAVSSKAGAITRGDELAGRNQFAQAITAYRTALERDPSDAQVHVKLSNAYFSDRQWEDALKEALRAAELRPGDLEVQMLATSRLLGTGHFLEAVIRASDLLRNHPNDVNVVILAGNATARLLNSTWALFSLPDTVRSADDFDRARSALRPAVPISEDKAAEAHFRLALQLAPALQDAQLALVNFLWAAGRPDEGEELLKGVADQNPRHAVVNYALGSFYAWRQRSAEAEKYLKNAAAGGQYGIGARFALADLYISGKRDREALAILDPMAATEDASGAVTLRAAPLESRLGNLDGAVRRIDGFLAREPQNPRALLLRAQYLLAQRRFGDAVKAARAAAAAAPSSAEARSALGQALLENNDLESAFAELSEAARLGPGVAQPQLELTRAALALGKDRDAVQFAREAVRHLPDNREAVVMLARALIRVKDFSSAERELTQFLVRSPESPDLLVQLGAVHAARGDAARARAAFTRALQSDDGSFDALSGIVSLDLQDGNTGAARRRADAASAAHPDDPTFLLLAARVYRADHDAARTETTLRRVLAVDPANVDATLVLSDLLVSQRKEGEARQLLEQLIERRPRSFEVETALATFLERTGRVAEARARYEKIVAEHPRAAVAAYRLAAIYLDKGGDLDAALNLAVSARQLLPEDAAASSVLGRIYVKKRLPRFAVVNFEDAVRSAPDSAENRYLLGVAYVSVKNYKSARAELTRALQLDANFAQARAALASLH